MTSELGKLILHHSTMFTSLHPHETHKFRWVMPPTVFDLMASHVDRTWSVDPPTPETPWTMFGMPIRVDEHVTNTMLELL